MTRDFVLRGGTVVFPEADLKVYLTASPRTRAERRLRQRGSTAVAAAELDRNRVLHGPKLDDDDGHVSQDDVDAMFATG